MATIGLLAVVVVAYTGGHATSQRATATATDSARAVAVMDRCVTCHGGARPAGALDLSSGRFARKGGASGPVLKPGDPEGSLLFQRVNLKQMPPGSPLSADEISLIRRWIAAGAVWPELPARRAGTDWWSLRPLQSKPPPRVTGSSAGSGSPVRNPIDAFIFDRLRSNHLKPAPPADRITLIRRVTYDLLGVPPTPDEIDRFLHDRHPNAYERLVDRLLADPRYGEHWGRHWLDVARFCESDGFERDNLRPNAWRYRDYVIHALNRDLPYSRFVTEQIAGDVLPDATQDSIAATGFLVCGPWDEVGNSQVNDLMKAHVREEELEDVVGTVCQTFLGLTVNCARCHDHKFDPILQRDYYQVKSAFEGVVHGERSLLTPQVQHQREAEASGIRLQVASLETRLAGLEAAARSRIRAPEAPNGIVAAPIPMAQWTFEQDARDVRGGLDGTLVGGARIERGRLVLDGRSGYFRSKPLLRPLREKTLEVWLTLTGRDQQGGAALSVQTTGGGEFDAVVYGERQSGKWIAGSELFHRTRDLNGPAETEDGPIHVAIVYQADNRIALYRNGKPYAAPYTPTGDSATVRTFPGSQSEILIGLRHTGAGNGFLHGEIEEARVYDRALTEAEIATSYRVGVSHLTSNALRNALTPAERRDWDQLTVRCDRARQRLSGLQRPLTTYAAVTSQPPVTHLLHRGDVEHPGEAVAAGGLSCLRAPHPDLGLAPDAPEALRRLSLARWITDPSNPLTARVVVNRVWHYHFGRGLVGTPNDFGFNGERPSHPELLDWLATQFVRDGERLKPLHRLILLSSVYRQASRFDPRAAAQDADDRLLWRFPPRRLEGEEVRDAMLSVSGELNPRMGGPSFQPFKVVVDNSHFYLQFDSADPEYNRRTVYRINVNSARSPLLESLDCPDPSTKTPRRAVTTTPIQALELMNNGFVQRQAQRFAARLEHRKGGSTLAQIDLAYRLAYGRAPSPEETTRASAFLRHQALTEFCWALLNSSEFLYVR